MSDWYQGKDNDDATRSVIDDLPPDDLFATFRSHLQNALKGLRKQSLEDAHTWVAEVKGRSVLDQRKAVGKLMALKLAYPECYRLFSHPILVGILEPVMEEWLETERSNVDLLCWMGILKQDIEYFVSAWNVDKKCQLACKTIASACISDVEYQCHHLGEGLFIGQLQDARTSLCEAEEKLDFLKDEDLSETYKAEIAHYKELLDLYDKWREDRCSSFVDFCESNSFEHTFPKAYYDDE